MLIQKRIQIKRLKGKTDIDLLFEKGEIVQTKTLLLKYLKNSRICLKELYTFQTKSGLF